MVRLPVVYRLAEEMPRFGQHALLAATQARWQSVTPKVRPERSKRRLTTMGQHVIRHTLEIRPTCIDRLRRLGTRPQPEHPQAANVTYPAKSEAPIRIDA